MKRSIALALIAACATTTPPATKQPRTSRGLHADDHLAAAREHRRRAEELRRWPEAQRTNGFADPASGLWYRAWDTAAEHDDLAVTHREAAARLHAAYDEACANIAPDRVRVSPLVRLGEGGAATDKGVVVYLRPEISAGDLLAELRCHRAWMMLAEAGMETCPLDLPGLHVQAHGDKEGISVEITVSDPLLVPELQRRAERDLEVAGTSHAAP
jgi:hypothetical protein